MSQEPPPTHTEKVNDCKRTNTRQLLNIPTRKLRWLVKNAAPIPDLPLETHGRIPINGTTALTVASRIEECLRKRSIDVEFNADAAQAKCKTENFVIYKIYLYQGVVKKNTIIVEVQRWKGCGIEFIHERNVIFSAAKGFGIDDFAFPAHNTKPLVNTEVWADMYAPIQDSELRNVFNISVNQLGLKCRNIQLFALQCLVNISNTKEMQNETARQISQYILNNDELLKRIIYLIHQDLQRKKRDDIEEQICLLSLQVLFNILHSMSESKRNPLKMMKANESSYLCLADILIEEIKHDEVPHIACLATKCLASLSKISNELRNEACERNIIAVLQQARIIGHSCHFNLEKESVKAMSAILGA